MDDKVRFALNEIKRGCVDFIGEEYIESLISKFYETNQRYKVKAGFDPTAPDLHLGHSVLLRKLATFQKYGGFVQFLIGDFTAMIGDPTGKSKTRKTLSKEEVLENAKTYESQVFKILDPSLTEVCFNSTWLSKMDAAAFLGLSSRFSVARMIERDDFSKRFKENEPISIVEFMYPLLQGYDSVALDCDLELGGNDQKFNLLVGRTLQRSYECKKEQSILTMPLLEGLDGKQKMSKSLNNYIALQDAPNDMYAKVLSISDELMWRYYELLSAKDLDSIRILKNDVDSGKLHPKIVKENLALELVSSYYNKDLALEAKDSFDSVFSKNEIPTDLEVIESTEGIWICKLLVDAGLVPSTSQARRDIKAGALKIDGEKISDENLKLSPGSFIVQIGKRKFIKVNIAENNVR
ncbi:tyrosine--tRNA ligase [Helicobacter sp. 13S00401-1]|uniref:tyrosine--tRNA ligase n=1 Tax=Helicobacter sp. 13S00401-1 TaxID=1905758 RepID=UPI000BA71999|nr:tyrosine--tRNA ligase [Helicobacter sp. 13S00401-1]PAF50778.1 tyrosine--tRNA ligase [Helicobacter sp. 13S00401-1]